MLNTAMEKMLEAAAIMRALDNKIVADFVLAYPLADIRYSDYHKTLYVTWMDTEPMCYEDIIDRNNTFCGTMGCLSNKKRDQKRIKFDTFEAILIDEVSYFAEYPKDIKPLLRAIGKIQDEVRYTEVLAC